jgi:hypothetical protein
MESSSQNLLLNWETIGKYVSYIYIHYHSKKLKLSEKERLLGIKKEFNKILSNVSKLEKTNIKKYIEKRNKQNKKLEKIQLSTKKFIEKLLPDAIVLPASSFSAKTNLVGESDIDFNVLFDKLNINDLIKISNICGANGFEFTEIRSIHDKGIHYVFQKFIDNVEIELKVREKEYYMKIHNKMHNYLDNIMSTENKNTITWIKHNLKKISKKTYSDFKAIYYEQALANAKVYKLLYPLL